MLEAYCNVQQRQAVQQVAPYTRKPKQQCAMEEMAH
jgi:hypothetical protein